MIGRSGGNSVVDITAITALLCCGNCAQGKSDKHRIYTCGIEGIDHLLQFRPEPASFASFQLCPIERPSLALGGTPPHDAGRNIALFSRGIQSHTHIHPVSDLHLKVAGKQRRGQASMSITVLGRVANALKVQPTELVKRARAQSG